MTPESSSDHAVPDQASTASALFAQLVMQQTNMALMLMGKVAHPESGQTYRDLEAARLFVDQLEMLEAKTKGNLTREEAGLLKQSLMSLRLAYVEAVDSEQKGTSASASSAAAASPGTPPAAEPGVAAAAAADEEHRKKFSKKY